jgi:signal recognition particle subunit SRP54
MKKIKKMGGLKGLGAMMGRGGGLGGLLGGAGAGPMAQGLPPGFDQLLKK